MLSWRRGCSLLSLTHPPLCYYGWQTLLPRNGWKFFRSPHSQSISLVWPPNELADLLNFFIFLHVLSSPHVQVDRFCRGCRGLQQAPFCPFSFRSSYLLGSCRPACCTLLCTFLSWSPAPGVLLITDNFMFHCNLRSNPSAFLIRSAEP